MKKTILSLIILAAGCISASAQQDAAAQQEPTTKEVFNPHWYVQAQGGFQETLGETSWSSLVSGNVQLAGGYQFTKLWGLRLTVGAWQSKGGIQSSSANFLSAFGTDEVTYKYNYVAPTLNATFNVTNAIWGYNPRRVVDFGVFAGVGLNIGFHNCEAAAVAETMSGLPGMTDPLTGDKANAMAYLWDGTKVRAVGQFGANLDFKVSKRVSLGLEANWNLLSDTYNSKKAGNVDWYFNTLLGVKVALGKVSKKIVIAPAVIAAPVTETRTIVQHDTVYITKKDVSKEPLRRDIFFTIRGSQVSKAEMPKIEDVAAYLNKYKDAKVTITGYADKGTGNPKINVGYAKNRADMVAKILTDKFGIAADRISVDSKGDSVQPYDINDLNRVSICVAQ